MTGSRLGIGGNSLRQGSTVGAGELKPELVDVERMQSGESSLVLTMKPQDDNSRIVLIIYLAAPVAYFLWWYFRS